MPDFDILIFESSTTIGSGSHKRVVREWQGSWVVPYDLRVSGKAMEITATSSKSESDARAKTLLKIDEFLSR